VPDGNPIAARPGSAAEVYLRAADGPTRQALTRQALTGQALTRQALTRQALTRQALTGQARR
jgi:hypothetical protein